MQQLKSLRGKIVDFAATSFIELSESTSLTASVCNVIYFNVEYPVIGFNGKNEMKRFPLCVCEDLRFPTPFKNMRKFLTLAFTKEYFSTVMYDDEREIFILKSDGKHYRTKVAISIVLHKGNPFRNNTQMQRLPINIRLPLAPSLNIQPRMVQGMQTPPNIFLRQSNNGLPPQMQVQRPPPPGPSSNQQQKK